MDIISSRSLSVADSVTAWIKRHLSSQHFEDLKQKVWNAKCNKKHTPSRGCHNWIHVFWKSSSCSNTCSEVEFVIDYKIDPAFDFVIERVIEYKLHYTSMCSPITPPSSSLGKALTSQAESTEFESSLKKLHTNHILSRKKNKTYRVVRSTSPHNFWCACRMDRN